VAQGQEAGRFEGTFAEYLQQRGSQPETMLLDAAAALPDETVSAEPCPAGLMRPASLRLAHGSFEMLTGGWLSKQP
jgi:hypothetical protein